MIGKISNYSPSFKSAWFTKPYAKILDKDGEQCKTPLSGEQMKRFRKIAKEINNLSEKLDVDVSGEMYIDEYKSRSDMPKICTDITICYHIQDEDCKKSKSLKNISRIDVNDSNKKLVKKVETTINNYKKYY